MFRQRATKSEAAAGQSGKSNANCASRKRFGTTRRLFSVSSVSDCRNHAPISAIHFMAGSPTRWRQGAAQRAHELALRDGVWGCPIEGAVYVLTRDQEVDGTREVTFMNLFETSRSVAAQAECTSVERSVSCSAWARDAGGRCEPAVLRSGRCVFGRPR